MPLSKTQREEVRKEFLAKFIPSGDENIFFSTLERYADWFLNKFDSLSTPVSTESGEIHKTCVGCPHWYNKCLCRRFTTPPPQAEGWEKEVWAWITKEMPFKHSDRFAPLFKIISSSIAQAVAEREKEGAKKSNDILRSMYQIAARGGKETNWEAFMVRLEDELKRQHHIMHPSTLEDIITNQKRK